MTRINTNVSSLIAQKTLARSNDQLQTSLTRLSTGLRINSGKDDPAGLIASEVLKGDITSTQVAVANNQRADQIIGTADSALGQVSSLLNDIKGLISQAANTGALSSDQIAANQLQVDSSLDSIDRIAQVTSFQGQRLLDGSLDFITTSPGTITTTATSLFGTTADTNASTSVEANIGGTTGGDLKFSAKGALAASAGNGLNVKFVDGAAGGAVTVSRTGTDLTFTITSGVTTANQIITALANSSASAVVSASLINGATGSGVFTGGSGYTDAQATIGSANDIKIVAHGLAGTAGNGIQIDVTSGSTASATLSGSTLTITVVSGTTTANQVINAINNSSLSSTFTASLVSGAGNNSGDLASGTNVDTTSGGVDGTATVGSLSGGADGNQIQLSAVTAGATANGVKIQLQDGVTAGNEIASYDGSSKTLTVTIQSGVSTAAQVAAAINAQGLFSASVASGSNGNGIYGGTGVNHAALSTTSTSSGGTTASNLQDINITEANFGTLSQIGVTVQIDKQATQGELIYSGGTLTNSLNLQVGGDKGFQTFNFGGGTTISDIATAINQTSDATGVQAVVSGSNLLLKSTDYGSSAFVSAQVLNISSGGSFNTTDANNVATTRSNGTDVQARINGIQATGDGLRASINTATLKLDFSVSKDLTDGSSVSFNITGGGANFQLGPDVISNQQARIGIKGVSTSTLGGVDGTLFDLRSGNGKSLTADVKGGASIVDEVINKITSLRGRLGAFQATTLQTNINSLNDTISNLSSAESTIADTDFAAEAASLQRAQILVQSGTAVLGIANSQPRQVLQLLQNL